MQKWQEVRFTEAIQEIKEVQKTDNDGRLERRFTLVFYLWFLVLYLLQELAVLFHQLIVALRLRLLQLEAEKQSDRQSKSLMKRFMMAERARHRDSVANIKFSSSSQQYSVSRKTHQHCFFLNPVQL